jgi:DNA polymerase III subunit delta'
LNFSNVVGQQAAKIGLLKMWKGNSMPHALLITGAEGTGGLPLAIALAQYIFCENRSDIDSCGKCAGCSKVARLEHADLHFSFPSISPKPNTKALSRFYMQEFREFVKQTPYGTTFEWLQFINAENKQGNIPAEECREIIEKLYLKSYEGGKKIQIIWRPEYLGKEGNILLKLIEEPPQDTIMIFVAENREDILATILSRTQEVKLAPIAAADIAEALSTRSLADPRVASQVAHLAMGSYTEALRLLQHAENDLFPDVKQMFNVIFTRNGPGISAFIEQWSKAGREQQKNLLHYVIQLLEHALKARYLPNAPLPLNDTEAEFARKFAAIDIPFENISKMIDALSDTIFYIERNAHGKTQLHALFIRLQYIRFGHELPAGT